MNEQEFAVAHILEAVNAAREEASNGHDADRLQAQTKLRLLAMSDEMIWELAKLTSSPPARPAESAYDQIKQAIRQHETTANEWLKDLSDTGHSDQLNNSQEF